MSVLRFGEGLPQHRHKRRMDEARAQQRPERRLDEALERHRSAQHVQDVQDVQDAQDALRESVRWPSRHHRRDPADEAPRSSLREWPLIRPSWPTRRGTGGWAAAALALHGLLLSGLLATRPLTVAPTHSSPPSSSLGAVNVRLLKAPSMSLVASHQAALPSMPSPPAPHAVPPPPMPLPIPAVILAASNESLSPAPPATKTEAADRAHASDAPSPVSADRSIVQALGPTPTPLQSPTSPQVPMQARAQPQDLVNPGAPRTTTDRSSPTPSSDQPASFPASHQSCQDSQTTRYYPALLRERGVQGQVRLRVKVDEHGRAAEVLVASGSGFRLLDDAARRVAESCPYVPARRGDQPVASWIEYAVRFALSPHP